MPDNTHTHINVSCTYVWHIHIYNTCEYYDLHCFCTHAENPETCPQTLLTKHTAIHAYIHIHNTIHMHAHKQHTTRTHMYAHVSVSLFNLKRCYLQFASNTRFYFVFFFFLHCHELSSFAFLVQWGRVTNRSYNLSENRNKIVEKSNNSSKCLLHALKTHTQAHSHTHTCIQNAMAGTVVFGWVFFFLYSFCCLSKGSLTF